MSSRSSEFAIGIDIGATSTRSGLVDRSGVVLDRVVRPTDRNASAASLVSRLADDVVALLERTHGDTGRRVRLGLAIPGTLDRDRKSVARSVALPAIEHAAILDDLSTRVGTEVSLWTDAEAATWGEYSVRAPQARRFVHLRLGTGVACGVVLDGQLQRLDLNRTTHLEALVVDHREDAAPCVCGLRGCLELVASGAVLLDQAAQLGIGHDLSDLDRAAANRDEAALELIEHVARAITIAFENLTRQFHAEVIVLGGGVMSHLPALRDAIVRSGQQSASIAPIEVARLGDDAGVIGAACLARD
ncbi:MAG: ROK family protein [Planctomycetes bacterium]|nr:ROK family protein [Planctomycetota bacterium]